MSLAVITGASKGIGFAIATALAEAGHSVVGVARSVPASFPGQFLQADLSTVEGTAQALTEIEQLGQVACLVNNLGSAGGQSLLELQTDALASIFDMNVRVGAQLASSLAPGMISRGYGRIVNLSSVVALGAPNRTSYAAAKAGVIAMTRAWALELAPHGVTVNVVAPGPVETEMFRQLNPQGSEGERRYLTQLPLGRVGRPAEIAALVRFLASAEAGFITGQTVFADGGWSIGRAG